LAADSVPGQALLLVETEDKMKMGLLWEPYTKLLHINTSYDFLDLGKVPAGDWQLHVDDVRVWVAPRVLLDSTGMEEERVRFKGIS
jgi:hypothetical protein